MQMSKTKIVNYAVLVLLGSVLVWVAVVSAMARAQKADAARPPQKAEGAPVIVSAPVVKPLPPALNSEFQSAQDQVETLQARLSAAAMRSQNILYKAALELKMTVREAETCEVKQVVRDAKGPVWSFICPAPELVQTPAPAQTKKKEP